MSVPGRGHNHSASDMTLNCQKESLFQSKLFVRSKHQMTARHQGGQCVFGVKLTIDLTPLLEVW